MEQRLQKLIADAGITSRRKAEQIILEGRVSVNGQPVSKLGSKADLDKDHVRVDGRLLAATTDFIYLLTNKPVGYVSTVKDPEGRPTVISLVKGIKQRVYPVGRLDFHSSGLMILTNDGELANFLMARASAIPRSYQVKLEGRPELDGIEKLRTGIVLDGRRTEPCDIRALGQDEKPWFEITLIEGRYHQVRRMFERIGKGVVKLKRVGIAFLTDQNLLPGKARHLTRAEVERLKAWKPADTARLKSRDAIGRGKETEARSKESVARIQESRVWNKETNVRSREPVAKSKEPITKSQETFARSKETGVRRWETGIRSNEPGVRNNATRGGSKDSGPRNRETFARNKESGARSKEADFKHRDTGVKGRESGARGKQAGVLSQEPGVRNRETFNRNKGSGVRSKETDFRSRNTGAKRSESGGRGKQAGVRRQAPGARSKETGAKNPKWKRP